MVVRLLSTWLESQTASCLQRNFRPFVRASPVLASLPTPVPVVASKSAQENALGRTSKDRQDGGTKKTESLSKKQALARALRAARDLPCLHFLVVLEVSAIGSSRSVVAKRKWAPV